MSDDSAAPAFGHRPNDELLDPLDETRFADFFQARIAPALQDLEAERTLLVRQFWRRAIVAGAVFLMARGALK